MSLRGLLPVLFLLPAVVMAAGQTPGSAPAPGKEPEAASPPIDWLERMRKAVVALDYEGTFVYQKGDQLDTLHIIHGMVHGRPMSRVTALSGERRQVLRSGDALTCIWPDRKRMLREPVKDRNELPLPLPEDPARIARHYRFEHGGRDRVAGFACRVIRITPRDDFRYGYEYCIEPETGMLLRAAVRDPKGKVMEQFLFTRISFPRQIPASAFDSDGYRGFRVAELPAATPKTSGADKSISFKALPPGFEVLSEVVQPPMKDRPEVRQVILGDGLATISVFVARAGDAQRKAWEGRMRSGAVQALADERAGWQITVVGEVPARTLEYLMSSIEVPQT